jgi:GNAT superfamily N-acetyltransferase
MNVEIEQISSDRLEAYAGVPIAFEVRSILEITEVGRGLEGFRLREVGVQVPYIKDCDASPEGGPEHWSERFDTSRWAFFLASEGGRAVGGATVAVDTPGLFMLAGRQDLAVLWDIRVLPELRRAGIGAELFRHAAGWSAGRACTNLKIETQNVNVPACRFYAKLGCRLGEIDRYAYAGDPSVAHEVMLVWYLDLDA